MPSGMVTFLLDSSMSAKEFSDKLASDPVYKAQARAGVGIVVAACPASGVVWPPRSQIQAAPHPCATRPLFPFPLASVHHPLCLLCCALHAPMQIDTAVMNNIIMEPNLDLRTIADKSPYPSSVTRLYGSGFDVTVAPVGPAPSSSGAACIPRPALCQVLCSCNAGQACCP